MTTFVTEAFTMKDLGSSSSTTFTQSMVIGGFLCQTAGSFDLASNEGPSISLNLAANTFTPMPFILPTGGIITLGATTEGVLAWNPC